MTRREFIPLAASAAASFAAAGSETQSKLHAQGWQVALTPAGNIASFRRGEFELVNRNVPGYGLQITFLEGNRQNICEHPTRSYQKDATSVFEFQFHDPYQLTVRLETELNDLEGDGVALTQHVALSSEKPIRERILVQLPGALQLPDQDSQCRPES